MCNRRAPPPTAISIGLFLPRSSLRTFFLYPLSYIFSPPPFLEGDSLTVVSFCFPIEIASPFPRSVLEVSFPYTVHENLLPFFSTRILFPFPHEKESPISATCRDRTSSFLLFFRLALPRGLFPCQPLSPPRGFRFFLRPP